MTNEQRAHDLAILITGKLYDLTMCAASPGKDVNFDFFEEYMRAYNSALESFSSNSSAE